METKIIECVPNFSEGRNKEVIDNIVAAIAAVEGVEVLDVDPGEATNRTVVTFVGAPEPVVEAAFRAVKRAAELIDMSKHHGAHPRMGATDVLPLIPVSGVTLQECAELARKLGERIANELEIPVYAYESAAFTPERKNLAVCRKGEYEALPVRMADPAQAPDFGARAFDEKMARTGATAVGARDFLIAVNFNLNTTSTRRANAIAFDVREKGRPAREGGKLTGKILTDETGKQINIPGTCKGTKAIGWFIDEYGIAQVSMNITDIAATPLHKAFEEVCESARRRGLRVTGTEIVGLIPRKVLLEAGKHFLHLQQRSTGLPEHEIMRIAVKSMGLDELKPWNNEQKVIENILEAKQADKKTLVSLSCRDFAYTTASEAPAPGGGSVAAYMGALAAALGTMVANLSAHKPGWDDRWLEFSQQAEQGQKLLDKLLLLVDADTQAFNAIMEAVRMPKYNEENRQKREHAMQQASVMAAQVPLNTAKTVLQIYPLLQSMAGTGNPASVSDAGVGALTATAAVRGAVLNVKINAATLAADIRKTLIDEATDIEAGAIRAEKAVLAEVESKISQM